MRPCPRAYLLPALILALSSSGAFAEKEPQRQWRNLTPWPFTIQYQKDNETQGILTFTEVPKVKKDGKDMEVVGKEVAKWDKDTPDKARVKWPEHSCLLVTYSSGTLTNKKGFARFLVRVFENDTKYHKHERNWVAFKLKNQLTGHPTVAFAAKADKVSDSQKHENFSGWWLRDYSTRRRHSETDPSKFEKLDGGLWLGPDTSFSNGILADD